MRREWVIALVAGLSIAACTEGTVDVTDRSDADVSDTASSDVAADVTDADLPDVQDDSDVADATPDVGGADLGFMT